MSSHHRSHRHKSRRHSERHRRDGDGGRAAGGSSPHRHRSHESRRSFSRFLRRAARHPLVPLTVICAIIVVLTIRTEQARLRDPVKMRIQPVGKKFDDPAASLQALQLMDAKRNEEAARTLLGLAMPPSRLSGFLADVRRGDERARDALHAIVTDWLLEQESASGANAFPSRETPTLVLNFIADVADYRGAHPYPEESFEREARLGAIFKRASVERQLRALDSPTLLRQAAATDAAPESDAYQPPVTAP